MSEEGSGGGSDGGGRQKAAEYFGYVYHLGVNSVGLEYCHLRFLYLKGKHGLMYKRDPHEFPGIKPIRKGVISHTLMVEDLGRRRVNNVDLYVLRLYNRLDETQKGEIARAEPGDVQKWMEAFDMAKQQADCDLLRGGNRQRLSVDNELNLEGHRPRVRRGLQNLVRIGKGPEVLLRQASDPGRNAIVDIYFEDMGDAIDVQGWKCVRTLNASTWEIRKLESSHSSTAPKCLVTQMLEIHYSFWDRWKKLNPSKFEKTIPYALLCQVSGLKEYFAAHPALKIDVPSTAVQSTVFSVSMGSLDIDDSDMNDEFYDAIVDNGILEDGESSDDDDFDMPKTGSTKLKNVSWALAGLALKRKPALAAHSELDTTIPPVMIDLKQFHGSLNQAKDDADKNCWSSSSGEGFMVRGKTYLKDSTKVFGGDPLLKLIAVDWLKAENSMDKVALHPKCLIQSEAGKKLPFVLLINLQIPAKPNYNLVLYYAAERPVSKASLLGKFVNGSDTFRDGRFKLIPRIVQGYWMVKRAVGTKAMPLRKSSDLQIPSAR